MPRIFLVDSRELAKEVVYFVHERSLADEVVYVTSTRELADKVVYTTTEPGAADRRVYRTDSLEVMVHEDYLARVAERIKRASQGGRLDMSWDASQQR